MHVKRQKQKSIKSAPSLYKWQRKDITMYHNLSITVTDSFINGIEKLKYMDETDDEAELATAEDKLLGESSTKELLQPSSPELRNSTESAESKNTDDNRGEAEMSSDSTLADGVMSKLNEKLAPIEDERTPMLPKDEDKDAASKS